VESDAGRRILSFRPSILTLGPLAYRANSQEPETPLVSRSQEGPIRDIT
jgi:hypothetical protein